MRNPVNRFIFWFLVEVVPRRVHQRLPHWVKVVLNPWMKYRGDPGDRAR